ncbi:MAG TPA: hypothetical protein DCM05_16810 [Elusimicrobia bacterium]|nr:hypothetical protein [Elusimicrobiota bacterium]
MTSNSGNADMRTVRFALSGWNSPESYITSPAQGAYVNTLANIAGTAQVYYSSVTAVWVSIKNLSSAYYWSHAAGAFNIAAGSPQFTPADFVGASSGTWSYAHGSLAGALTSGTSYLIEVRAQDSGGGVQSPDSTSQFVYDVVSPIAYILQPVHASAHESFPTIMGTASDYPGQVQQVQVKISSGPSYGTSWSGSAWTASQTYLLATGTQSWSYPALDSGALIAGTTYAVNARAMDMAGSTGSVVVSSFLYTGAGGGASFTGDFSQPGGAVYDGGDVDELAGMAVDTTSAGGPHLFIAGYSTIPGVSANWIVIKYDTLGVKLASAALSSGNDGQVYGLAFDPAAQQLIVVGRTAPGAGRIAKYTPNLALISSASVSGEPTGVAVGYEGGQQYLYVAGFGSGNIWAKRYDASLGYTGVTTNLRTYATDVRCPNFNGRARNGYYYVEIGYTDTTVCDGTNPRYGVYKLSAASLTQVSSGPSAGGLPESNARDLALDAAGNVFVVGYTTGTGHAEQFVVKYDQNLLMLASATASQEFYTGSNNGRAGVAIDTNTSDVYVAGWGAVRYTNDLVLSTYNVYAAGVFGVYVQNSSNVYVTRNVMWDFVTQRVNLSNGPATPSAFTAPVGCGLTKNVKKDGSGDYTTIQAAVNALPISLSTTTCVVVRDTQTYAEQVTVQGFTNNGWRLKIMADPSFISTAPVINPPALSTAAFLIRNASVTLQGFKIQPASVLPYGILSSSASAAISGIVLNGWAKVSVAAVSITTGNTVSGSSVAVQHAIALQVTGLYGAVTNSTFTASGGYMAADISGASSCTFQSLYVENAVGEGFKFSGASWNTLVGSTLTSSGDKSLYIELSTGNLVTGSVVNGMLYVNYSAFNRVELSTVNGNAEIQNVSSYNTFDRMTITATTGIGLAINGGVEAQSTSHNTVMRSTITNSDGIDPAVELGATSNTVTQSLLRNLAGPAAQIWWSRYGSISMSTMIGGEMGLVIFESTGARIDNCYIQGSTAVSLSGVEDTAIDSSVVSGTVFGVATEGAPNFTDPWQDFALTNSTIVTGGTGVRAHAPSYGQFKLGNVVIRGPSIGVFISSPASGGNLSLSSVSFQGLAAGATAMVLGGGSWTSTFTAFDFVSASMAVNVDARLLGAGARITMASSTGTKAGPLYENDPGGYVDWLGFASYMPPAGCGLTKNVKKDGSADHSTIQGAMNALPISLTTTACVVIRDTQTYSEQVTVQGFTNNGYRLKIMAEPGLTPVISPPALSTAAFLIKNSSVTLQNLAVVSISSLPYGIASSSAYLTLSGVGVSGWNYAAGVAVTSYSTVDHSSVAIQNTLDTLGNGALYVIGEKSVITDSTASSAGSNYAAVYLLNASSNTILRGFFSSNDMALRISGGAYNEVSLSTMIGSTGLYAGSTSSNTVTGCYLQGTSYAGIDFTGGRYSTVAQSTAVGAPLGTYGFYMTGGSSWNKMTGVVMRGQQVGMTLFSNSVFNTVQASTISGSQNFGLQINAASNTVTNSFMSCTSPSCHAVVIDYGGNGNTIGQSVLSGSYGMSFGGGPPLPWGNVISTISFQSLPAGATGFSFANYQLVMTMTNIDFGHPNLAVNVNGSLLPAGSHITLMNSAGAKAGPLYENDPNSYVDWPGFASFSAPSGCGVAKNVKKDGSGDHTTIQAALNALPVSLTTTTCVVVRDTQTYNEQVVVQNIATNGYRLKIMADPSFVSTRPVVDPPASSSAAFLINSSSVTLENLLIRPTHSMVPGSYGVWASSADVSLTSVTVDGGTYISDVGGSVGAGAAVHLSSWSSIAYSSVTTASSTGIRLTGVGSSVSDTLAYHTSFLSAITFRGASSCTVTRVQVFSTSYGISLNSGASFNTVTRSTISGTLALSGASWNIVSSNTISGSPAVFILNGASSNTLVRNRIDSPGSAAVAFTGYSGGSGLSGSAFNTIALSTLTSASSTDATLEFQPVAATTGNLVTDSYIYNSVGDAAYISYSIGNAVVRSTLIAEGAGASGLIMDDYEGSSTTVSDCFIKGSSAAWVSGPHGTVLERNLFSGSGGAGSIGLGVYGGSYYEEAVWQSVGALTLSSNTIQNAAYGLIVDSSAPGFSIAVSSLNFTALLAGATAIKFVDAGVVVATISAANFTGPNTAVNVDGSGLGAGSRITMAASTGTKAGPLYESDPNGYVDWPGTDVLVFAVPSYPADGSFVNVQPNYNWVGPSTTAVAGLGVGASYRLQVSNNDPGFSSTIISISTLAVVHSTDIAVDHGVYISTFTLSSNTTYFWRVAVAGGDGTPGPWSPVYSFRTDFISPTTSGYLSVNSTGGVIGEEQWNNLVTGVTVQITVQDITSGLAITTAAVSFSGDGHDYMNGTSGFGVMYSTNAGASWIDTSTTSVSNGGVALGVHVFSLAVFKDKLFAGDAANGKVYVSVDGDTWDTTNGGAAVGLELSALAGYGGKLYAADNSNFSGKIYVSTDGNSWSATNSGGAVGTRIKTLAVYNGKIYAGDEANGRIYVSADGDVWSATKGGAAVGSQIEALTAYNGKLYAGDINGNVYESVDGNSWSTGVAVGNDIRALAIYNGRLYAGSNNDGKIYVSADGSAWSAVNGGAAVGSGIFTLSVMNGKLYAGDFNGKVYVSADGNVWNMANCEVGGGTYIHTLAAYNGRLFAGGYFLDGKIYKFSPINTALPGSDGSTSVQALTATGLNLAPSTNTLTCAGVSPCGATNQVKFTVTDMAGNVRTAGPYAVLVGSSTAPAAQLGCGLTKTVQKDGSGDHTTIQAALNALPVSLTTTTCVVIRDTQTYAEQVTVQGFTNNGYRLKIMADPSFISSAPVVSPPALSTAAFLVMNASVSVQGFALASTSPFAYGVYASSAYLNLDGISVSGNLGYAGVFVSSWSTVTSATVTASNAHGFIVTGLGSLLSGSRANIHSSSRYALWINGASSSTFTAFIASNTAGIALEVNGDSRWNQVQQSTVAGDTAGLYALYVSSGYANVFSDCFIRNSTGNAAVMGWWSSGNTLLRSTVVATAPQASALTLMSPANLLQDSLFRSASGSGLILSGAHLNTILRSTVTTDSSASDALYVTGSDSNTISESYIQNLSGDALTLTASRNDTVTLSTAVGGPEGFFALYLTSGSSHVITRNRILSPTGGGIRIVSGAHSNLISLCDVRAWADALDINAGSSNTITRSFLTGGAGYALSIQGGSPFNVVSQSTMTGGNSYTIQLVILSSSTIEDSYIEGRSPIIIYHSTGVAIRSSVIVATSATGTALWTNLGNQGLVVSSNVLVGGSQGNGFRLDMQTPSSILLSSNTVRGARYGVHVGTPVAGDSLSISGLTLEDLAPGAAGIRLMSGTLVSTFSGVAFNDASLAVNVDAGPLYPGSRITMVGPSGPKAGPAYESDPNGYVDWPGYALPGGVVVWDGGGLTTSASEAANWSGDLAPADGALVRFDATSSKDCVWDYAVRAASMTLAPGYQGTLQLASSMTITGDLTLSSGTLRMPVSGATITLNGGFYRGNPAALYWENGRIRLGGDLVLNGADNSASPGAVLEFVGPLYQVVSGTGSGILPSIEVHSSSEVYFGRGGGGISVWDVLITAGRLNLGGQAAIFSVKGDWTQTGGVFAAGTSTVAFYGGNPSSFKTLSVPSGTAFYNLRVGDLPASIWPGYLRSVSTLTVTNSVILSSGAFDPGPYTLTLGGSWEQTGASFNPSSGTVLMQGSAPARILQTAGSRFRSLEVYRTTTTRFEGAVSAKQFRMDANAVDVFVQAGSTLSVETARFWSSSAPIRLRSSIPGVPWHLDLSSAIALSRVDVQDSDASDGLAIPASTVSNIDSGRNLNWDFDVPRASITCPASMFVSQLSVVSGTSFDQYTPMESLRFTMKSSETERWLDSANHFTAMSPVWLTPVGTGTWTLDISTIGFVNGYNYWLHIEATDSAGQRGSHLRTILFDSAPPSVAVLAPSSGSVIDAGMSVSGTASDQAGVSRVELRFSRLSDGFTWDFDSSAWTAAPGTSAVAVALGTASWSFVPPQALREAFSPGSDYYVSARGVDFSSPANTGAFQPVPFTFVDGIAPSSVSVLSAAFTGAPGALRLDWLSAGDDGASGVLPAGSAFFVQRATFPSVEWSTAAAQLSLSTSGVAAGQPVSLAFSGLNGGTTFYFRVWTQDEAGNVSPPSGLAFVHLPLLADRLAVAAPGEVFTDGAGRSGTPSPQLTYNPFPVHVYAVEPSSRVVASAHGWVRLVVIDDPWALVSPSSAPLINGQAAFTLTLTVPQLARIQAEPIEPLTLLRDVTQVTSLSGTNLLVAPASLAPNSAQQGAGVVGMLALSLRTNAGTMALTGLSLRVLGSTGSLTGVSLFRDADASGLLDANADVRLTSAAVSGAVTLGFAHILVSTIPSPLFLAVGVSSGAPIGSQFSLLMDSTASFAVSGGSVAFQAIYPIQSGTSMVSPPSGTNDDLLPPLSAILSPAHNSYPPDLALLRGTASDNVAVDRVLVGIQRPSDGKWWDGTSWAYVSAPVLSTASYVLPEWALTSGPSSASLTAGQLYRILSWAVDSAGNFQTTAALSMVSISSSSEPLDRTPPLSAILYPASGSALSSLGTVSGTAFDETGLARVETALYDEARGLWWNGAGWGAGAMVLNAAQLGNGYWSWPLPAASSFLTEGSSYTLLARAADAAGNLQSPFASSSFTYQAAVVVSTPQASITLPMPGAVVTTLAQISGTSSGSPAMVRLWVRHPATGRWWKGSSQEWTDAASVNYAALSNGFWSFGSGPSSLLANSSYTVQAEARDSAGTLVQTPPALAVVFTSTAGTTAQDTLPPVSAILSPAAGASSLVSLGVIAGTALDNAKVTQVFVGVRRNADASWWGEASGWLSGQVLNPVSLSSPSASFTAWSYAALPDSFLTIGSSYTILAWAKDSFNNIQASPAERSFTFATAVVVDTTPPAAVTDLAAVSTAAGQAELRWTAPGDDGLSGRAAAYLVRYSTAGPLTPSNFSGARSLSAPAPASPGSAEAFVVYGLESGKLTHFAVRGKDEAGNLSPYFNSASALVLKPVVPGDGSGAAVWSPANAPACSLITATMTFTNGTHTFQAGGLAAFQLPEGWPEPQLACSTCAAFVRVVSTTLASLEPVLLKDFGPRWAGALVTSGQLLGGETVRIAVDRVQPPLDLRTGAALPARSRASFGGEARALLVLPSFNQVAGPAAAVRLSDASVLSLGPGQVSPPIFLEGLDACGRYRSAPSSPREVTLWVSAGGELSLSPAFAAPASSMTVVLSTAATPPVFFRSALSGARTLDVAYVDLEQGGVLRRLSRGMSVLGSVIGFMPGSVGVSTGANLPAKASALITPDGDQNADGAFILFTPSLSSVSWRVSVSSAGDFSAAWRQYAGTGDPGRGVYFDGKDASGRIRPGPYYVRIELNGGVAVDTATIALNVGTMGIAGKVKVGEGAVANARVSISGPGASREERSEADGSYAFYGLRAGTTYFLSAEYFNSATGETARTTAAFAAPAASPAADLSLLLTGRLRVSARIARPAGSDLYGEVRIRDLASARSASGRLRFAAGAMSSDDGGASLSTWTLFTVLPDTYVVTLALPGYEAQTATVTLAAGSVLDIQRAMTRKADLYGRFELPELQEYGTAVAVEARRSTDTAPAQTAMLYLPGLKDEGRTPALSGVFVLAGLEPGAYTLTARAIGFEPVSAGPYTVGWEDLGGPDTPLALLPVAGYGGSIAGSVAVQGDTLSKGAFTLTLSALNQRTGAMSFTKAAFSPSAALSSATYRITGLGAGSYRVITALEGFELASATAPVVLSAGGSAEKSLLLRQFNGQVRALLTLPAGYADYGSVSLVLKSSSTEITGTADSSAWLSPATLATARWTLSARYARTGAVASRTVDVVSGALSDAVLDLSGQTQLVSGTVSLSGSVSLSMGTYTFTASDAAGLSAASALSSFCSRAYGGCVSTTSFRLELYSLDDAERGDGLFAPIGADGRYRFENVPSGAYVLLNATELDGSAADGSEVSSSWQVLRVASSPVTADMSLLAGKEVRGRFLLPSGALASRLFTVSLLDRSGAAVQSQSVSLQDAAEGAYALPRIADGSYLLLVQDGSAPRQYVAAPRPVTVSGADVEVGDIQLSLMGGITGSLRLKQLVYGSTTSLITPITPLNAGLLPEALQVFAMADPWVEGGFGSAERSNGRILLDDNGRFSITGLVPGKYKVRFEQSGGSDALGQGGFNLAPAELSGVEVSEGQSKDVGDVDLPVAQTVNGAVRDPNGHPLANVEVSAEAVGAAHRVAALTDASGRFTLVGLDPSLRYYDILALRREGEEESDQPRSAYGEARLSGVDILTRYSGIDLALPLADADLVCAVSASDGRALNSPHPVYGSRPGAKVFFLRSDSVPRSPNGDLAVFTAADGALRVRSLVPGSYTLTAFALDHKRAAKTLRLRSGSNSSCSISLEPEEVALSGVLTHFDGSSPSSGEVEQVVAAAADGSERLYAELVRPGNSQVVTHYELAGLRVGTVYQLLVYDADGDVYAPPEAASLRFDSAGEQRLNLHIKPVRPAVSASVVKQGERLFELEFTATKALRKRTDADEDAAGLVRASTGTLTGARISPDRKTLSVSLDAAGVSAASATVRFRAFSNVSDPESADPLNPELSMETTAYVFIGIDSAMETPVNSQKGGTARVGGADPSNVTLPAGSLDVAASSVVVVGVQRADANQPGQRRAQGGYVPRYSAAAYPKDFYKALAAAPPGIRPLSAFYDIFLPLGVRTQLRKPAELVIKYDTMTVTDPTKLNLYWYNEAANAYVLQQDSLGLAPEIDYVNHTVKVRVNHFSTFVLINSRQVVITNTGDFSGGALEAFNYPNPFDLRDKTVVLSVAGQNQSIRGTMIRVAVPPGTSGTGRVHIFNVAGERVRTLEFVTGAGGQYVYVDWDGRNDSGRDVASGVYVGEVKLGGGKAFFKMGLIK